MANVTQGRIYAPPTDESNPNDRDVIYPETCIESVVTRTDGTTLKDDIGPKVIITSGNIPDTEKPSVTDRPVFWINPTGTVEDV